MQMPPCPATSGSWQVLKVLGDGGLGEGPSFKKGLPPKMHFHENGRVVPDRQPQNGHGTKSELVTPRFY